MRYIGSQACDLDECVRLAVAVNLPRAAPRRSREAISMLTPMAMGDADIEVRCQAFASIAELGGVTRSRSRSVVHVLAYGMEDKEHEVRVAAVKALIACARLRRTALDAVALRLAHKDKHVREAATIAFKGVVEGCSKKMRKRVTAQTLRLLGSSNRGVREAAAAAMEFGVPEAEGEDGDELRSEALATRTGSGEDAAPAPSKAASRRSAGAAAAKGPNRAAVVQAGARMVKRIFLMMETLDIDPEGGLRAVPAKPVSEKKDPGTDLRKQTKEGAEGEDDGGGGGGHADLPEDDEAFSNSGTDLDDDEVSEPEVADVEEGAEEQGGPDALTKNESF